MTGTRRLAEGRLPELLEVWRRRGGLWGPTRDPDGRLQLAPLAPGVHPELSFGNFVTPPTIVLLPFRAPARLPAAPPAVLFGVRPCDASALEILDRHYRGEAPHARAYAAARAATAIVALACARPRSTCFCAAVGGGPAESHGADLLLNHQGSDLLLSAHTARGRELLDAAGPLLTAARPAVVSRAREAALAAEERMVPVRLDGIVGALDEARGTSIWTELGRACRGCRVCGLLCPAHPIEELEAPAESVLPPAERRGLRWRRRLFDRFHRPVGTRGRVYCVGCGRCVLHCPVHLDLRTVLRDIRNPLLEFDHLG